MAKVLYFYEYGDYSYNMGPGDWAALKSVTCAFTGHRPQHIGFSENDPRCDLIKKRLMDEIENAVDDGYKIFISGAALGVDTWAALNVLKYKRLYPFIRLELAIPCIGQESRWSKKDKEIYAHLLDNADSVIRISRQPYYNGCMRIRNAFMVRRSSRLIAVFNGKPGGTSQTIDMAKDGKTDVVIIKA